MNTPNKDQQAPADAIPEHSQAAEPAPANDIATLLETAIDTELETGRRESSREKARAHVLLRLARGAVGLVLTLAGVTLTVLPGPGIPLILVGLSILALDYPYAAKLRDRLLSTGRNYAGRAGRILKRILGTIALLVLITSAILLLLAVTFMIRALV
jgi:hypothetical protein